MTRPQSLSIILVAPQMGENIGAVARAMSNFAIADLRIVSPRDGWPNQKANAMAANGEHIIENAKVFDNLDDAIADMQYIVATASHSRYLKKSCISSKKLTLPNCRVGILFGCERSGLTNEQLSMADILVQIPSSEQNPSLNIAVAAAIIFYEIFEHADFDGVSGFDYANKSEINFFFKYLEESLEKKSFFKNKDIAPAMKQNIRDIFLQKNLTSQDVRTLMGAVKALNSKH